MVKRRTFLAAAAASAGAAASSSRLAIDGGAPVRETPLRAGYFGPQYYDDKEEEQLREVLKTGRAFRWYGPGNEPPKKVLTFEKEFAARMQTRYALAVTSGTAALQCALAALEVGPGDEVILPAWTWHSCFNTVVLAGALPVCAEIDESFNLDPNDIERHITPRTKVIMAVHLQGNPCDMDRILAIARKHNLRVLEDCAQAVGASYKGRPVGSMGDIGIYSLQLNKTITAGEGGAVVTNDPVLFERASRFHDLGGLRPPHREFVGEERLSWFIGTNFRMSEFTGGVLLAQVRKLDAIVNAVRANAQRVYDGIRDLPGLRLRHRPDPDGDMGAFVFLGFASKAQRDRFVAAMKAENVPASPPSGSVILPVQPHIEKKITVHPAWPSFTSERGRAIQYGAASCPRTIDILNRFAGVALDPKFTKKDTDDIVAAIRKVYPEVIKA
ncbi:MAG: DegT/DnrJ/EryC1/StrS family aminotransferase [Bryobacterales bacterium]|nr:DegT/DnrJ/EryC1/StrS family aminotransferase [Bryobacterales bacterium]